MQQSAPPGFMTILSKADPHLLEHVNGLRDHVMSDGALSAKVKTLMTLICDALLTHTDGVRNIANRARGMGASEQEIAEAVEVAYLMGGLPALVTGCNAFPE